MIMSIAIVRIAIFVRVVNGVSRVSLRSKGQIDVSKIAGVFDGGGHFNAAGCTIESLDVKKVKEIILKEIFETYK
jgi:phosphoesterase RecJ-like protein